MSHIRPSIAASSSSGIGADGWIAAEPWTFASFTAGPPAVGTFTVTGDATARYTVGTRIKLTQATQKFFVVTADPVFAAGSTTITISAGTSYALTNAAISGNAYSYVINPQGYPPWFTFDPAPTGFSGAVTTTVAQFAMAGKSAVVAVYFIGTSNSTGCTVTLPTTCGAGLVWPCLVTDNGTSMLGRIVSAANSVTGTASSSIDGLPFTASGLKAVDGGPLIYPVA